MTLKMTTETTTMLTAKKTSRLPRSLGLTVTIVIVIAAIYGLLMVALSTVATAYSSPVLRTIDDPTQRVLSR